MIKKIHTKYYLLFLFFAVAGFIFSWIFKGHLYNHSENFGPFAIGLFVPVIASVAFLLTCAFVQKQISRSALIFTLAIFLISSIPFAEILQHKVYYPERDDGYRYSITAHNMVANKTLWGSDGILKNTGDAKIYTFNPGYRYFLAFELLICGSETRGLQLFNLLLWVFVVAVSTRQLITLFKVGLERNLFLLFIGGSSLYAAKNILLNLSEWFCILLLLLFLVCMLNKRFLLAAIFLGLAVFVRQNLLFGVLLLLIVMLKDKNRRERIVYSVTTLFIIALPLFHNIYYGHQWKWLPGYTIPFKNSFIPDSTGNIYVDFLTALYRTTIRYITGMDLIHTASQNFFGIIFIPPAIVLMILQFKKMDIHFRRLFFLQFIFVIGPTLLLNWAYFPRFEFINLFTLLITSVVLLTASKPLTASTANYLQKLQ